MDDVEEVIETINAAQADLLLVAMGNPLQEHFIMANWERLNPTVCIGVGALFGFMPGAVVRALGFVRTLGLEWLFRFLQEPRRLARRYCIGIPRFLLAALRLRRQ
ncbi:WecB/TagA/CpsF family glycosyltransferase [Breoghania sp.]|uniref:WecB/TagA/CpsF family glycosyltransferase n=1 Tax=Breoghania sp. TaxID=2065378 RepID=UPI00261C0E05|nr:WecB/TagA/CpsF family glycosyltransferase [Breoghania sp.]MDJ0930998.1 WecB/TagA/CpsF family glycosyltransferase [Breoghania sp.]